MKIDSEQLRQKFGDLIGYECIAGACLTYENAEKHLKYSAIAAKQNDFGFAVSHLILGAEEIIKAFILICLYRETGFLSDEEKVSLFRFHNFKHINIKEMLTACTELKVAEFESQDLIYIFGTNKIENKYQYAGYFITQHFGAMPIGEEEIGELCALIDKANELKNNGFYVDFNTNWIVPEEITEETYSKYSKLIKKLDTFIRPIFTLPVEDDRMMRFIYNE